jgi:hypothetical protein
MKVNQIDGIFIFDKLVDNVITDPRQPNPRETFYRYKFITFMSKVRLNAIDYRPDLAVAPLEIFVFVQVIDNTADPIVFVRVCLAVNNMNYLHLPPPFARL